MTRTPQVAYADGSVGTCVVETMNPGACRCPQHDHRLCYTQTDGMPPLPHPHNAFLHDEDCIHG